MFWGCEESPWCCHNWEHNKKESCLYPLFPGSLFGYAFQSHQRQRHKSICAQLLETVLLFLLLWDIEVSPWKGPQLYHDTCRAERPLRLGLQLVALKKVKRQTEMDDDLMVSWEENMLMVMATMVMFLNSPSIIYGMIYHHVYCRRSLYNVQLLPFSSGIKKQRERAENKNMRRITSKTSINIPCIHVYLTQKHKLFA